MPNLLANSRSVYLQQHKDNPVDWWPWSKEALEKAKRENKPIFLSIGYSSCHWCHVMEKESFSLPEVARVLNEFFVPIKVDREERPDLDQLYMRAVQAMTGQGGWPLNVFLTPDLRPFYGGTYFAPDRRYGRPGFIEVLERVRDIYVNQSDELRKSADSLTNYLFQTGRYFEEKKKAESDLFPKVLRNLEALYDPENGGFGPAPKFFYTDGLKLFLLAHEISGNEFYLESVQKTLTNMCKGGVFDQVGGGFHRYSTDEAWMIPHYEKMLYDNALLVECLALTVERTQDPFLTFCLERTIDWIFREMKSPSGGFYSAMDADSEGQEGKFYVWSKGEIEKVLSLEEAQKFFEVLVCSQNAKAPICLNRALREDEIPLFKTCFEKLRKQRDVRTQPGLDTKIQTSWNGLLISALCKAFDVRAKEEFIKEAERTTEYIWKAAFQDGLLRHLIYDGTPSEEAFLEDQVYFGKALLDLFYTTQKTEYFSKALDLAEGIKSEFYDDKSGGFWTSSARQTDLLLRFKDIFDGALPSSLAIGVSLFQNLYLLTGREDLGEVALRSFESVLGTAEEQPGGFSSLAWASVQMDQEKILMLPPPSWVDRPWTDRPKSLLLKILRTDLKDQKLKILEGKNKKDSFFLCDTKGCQDLSEPEIRQLFSSPVDKVS